MMISLGKLAYGVHYELAYVVHMKESTPMPTDLESPDRRRRPRGSITAAAILDAAEELAADGLEALTVRSVTASIQASPMAFYRHFETKDALVDALLDRVLGRFEPPSVTDDWAADLHAFAVSHRRILQEHPWAITPLFSHPNPGLNAARIGEQALRILQRAGIAGDQAVATFSGVIALNYGWSAFTSARDARRGGDADPEPALRDVLSALPATEFRLTIQVATAMGNYGSDAHYDVALDQLLTGIHTAGAT
jgi:AcrR family transcriptional regulator